MFCNLCKGVGNVFYAAAGSDYKWHVCPACDGTGKEVTSVAQELVNLYWCTAGDTQAHDAIEAKIEALLAAARREGELAGLRRAAEIVKELSDALAVFTDFDEGFVSACDDAEKSIREKIAKLENPNGQP